MPGSETGAAIVIDAGSGQVKAGFAGDDTPRCIFPNVVGRPKQKSAMPGAVESGLYVGAEAIEKRGTLNLSYPIHHGYITDWDMMEGIWRYTFTQELEVDPSECYIMLTDSPVNSKHDREKMMITMFEEFMAPSVYISMSAIMSMHTSGHTTGLVVESGDGVTHIVPVQEGYAVQKSICRSDVGGSDITRLLQKQLQLEGAPHDSISDLSIVQDIKEKLCYAAHDYHAELSKDREKYQAEYVLPDGKSIAVRESRFIAAEAIFTPTELLNNGELGIHELIEQSILESETDIRDTLAQNIVLGGGNTMLNNFPERLEAELKGLMAHQEVKVSAPPERKYSAWIGGSMFASHSSFAMMTITKEEYEEEGPSVVHRKCF